MGIWGIMKGTWKNTARAGAILTAALLILTAVFWGGRGAVEASQSDDAMAKGYPGLCMDGVGYSSRSIRAGGDVYEETEEALETGRNRALLYWAFISNREDGQAAGQKYRTFRETVNRRIREGESGLPPITSVSVADIKKLIHQDPQVAGRYPWLEAALEHPEEYLSLGLSGRAAGAEEKEVPSWLAGALSPDQAYLLEGEAGPAGYVLSVADQGLIDQAEISFVTGGEGWSWTKGPGTVTFWNTGGSPGAVAALDLSGTGYRTAKMQWPGSRLYEDYMHWYTVTRCGGDHFFQGYRDGVCPLEKHQRLYSAELPDPGGQILYVKMGEVPSGSGENGETLYRHEETFTAHYTIEGIKRDHETGRPLEGALFQVLESFPDRNLVKEEEGDGVLCRENCSPSPAVWEGFRQCGSLVTDKNGRLSHTDIRTYDYSKTYCGGHPTPGFLRIPEKDRDPETGEVTNQGEIDRARAANGVMAAAWLQALDDCREREEENQGKHFHWMIDSGVEAAVRGTKDTGEPCRAVGAVSVETAFEKSGCREDCENSYEAFINLKYSYTLKEETARSGYTVHGAHGDDVPVEVITTDSSEAGANESFAGIYSRDVSAVGDEGNFYRKNDTGQEKEASVSDGISPLPGGDPEFSREETILPSAVQSLLTVRFRPETKILEEADRGKAGEEILTATPSERETELLRGTRSEWGEAVSPEKNKATPSQFSMPASFAGQTAVRAGTFSGETIPPIRLSSFRRAGAEGAAADGIRHLGEGEDGENVSHVFQIYDHRTEGEIHFNKRDLDLYRQEEKAESSYGQSQGDGTLEGAVYGLFAAEDIIHPDGGTGVVYEKGSLTAVASTDKNGDGAFLVYTEAPGTIFSYETGTIRPGTFSGPDNLYHGMALDDYMGDGENGTRIYGDNETQNGNVWIGRPLIMGKYEIRELSRSEGYELSVNGKSGAVTNFGASLETETEETAGTAVLTRPLGEDVQMDESGYGELEFAVLSSGTSAAGYDILVEGYPEGTEFFREDEGTEEVWMEIGTGSFEKILLWEDLQETVPRYRRARSDTSDPVYENGRLKTELRQMERTGLKLPQAKEQKLEEEELIKILRGEPGEDGTGAFTDDEKNQSPFLGGTDQKNYIKYKLEQALRTGGYATPRDREGRYSTETVPVYDRGVRKGEKDLYGISGCRPGERAEKTVWGSAVADVGISDGESLTVGDVIWTLISFYRERPWWSCGGLDAVDRENGGWVFTLYQSAPELGDGFFVAAEDQSLAERIYLRKGWDPADPEKCPRWVYAVYGAAEDFGRILHQEMETVFAGGAEVSAVSAAVTPDFTVTPEGELKPWLQEFPVYYKMGEIVLGADGKPEQDWEEREVTERFLVEKQSVRQQRLPAEYDRETGVYRIHVDTAGTDSFGRPLEDGEGAELLFRAVTPEKERTLTGEDIQRLKENWMGWKAGDTVGYGRYLLQSGAEVRVVLSGDRGEEPGDHTFIQRAELQSQDQEVPWEDGGTRTEPVQVLERPIRQKVRIRKTIASHEDNTYPVPEPSSLPGFQFKIYLRSNLERLCRDGEGNIVFIDRNGRRENPLDDGFHGLVWEESAAVPQLYTRISHREDSLTAGPVSNNVRAEAVNAAERLYPYDGGLLRDEPESGYVRLLEPMRSEPGEDLPESPGGERIYNGETVYNYEKFFDGIRGANEVKWDRDSEDGAEYEEWIRQFAIRWYLDDEVKKRTRDNGMGLREGAEGASASQMEIHDQALAEARKKAENYLKPFLEWDLDEICAVPWDGGDGGEDKDLTTLTADQPDGSGYYTGVSRYLPYGVYVIAEQIPGAGQFRQKHYEADPPREIVLPAVLDGEGQPDHRYDYDPELSLENQAADFHIRFGEEWGEGWKTGHVIQAHSGDGDFEVYKFGLEPDRIQGEECLGYRVTQAEFKPFKDLYSWENVNSRYHNERVGEYYPYGSLSEDGRVEHGIRLMLGSLTAREGEYAPALVPWTVREPAGSWDTGPFVGYASQIRKNRLYRSVLRIEKTDRETGEMILGDSGAFALYRGLRREDGEGEALFYEEDTVISGSREFLEAMGARQITPAAREDPPYLGKYYGTVPEGTPICREEDLVSMTDELGKKTGEFLAFSTVRDGRMPDEEGKDLLWADQNSGYVRLLQPLGAGVYVLAELRPPAGYVRSRPIAVEIYSDRVTYYRDGEREQKTAAWKYESREESPVSQGSQASAAAEKSGPDLVRIPVENQPVRLTVEKKKGVQEQAQTVLDGRVTGSLGELNGKYGLENLELAFNASGTYLGYGWKKGFVEELEGLRVSGTDVELIYEDGVFSGRAKLSRKVDQPQSLDSWLPGAELTLLEGIPLKESGETEDLRYEGLRILRGEDGNVSRMYVEKGYGGERLVFVKDRSSPEKDPEETAMEYSFRQQEDDRGEGTWTVKRAWREDTDILYYRLDNLSVLRRQKGRILGYDRNGAEAGVKNGESSFALKDGRLFLEIICPDYENLNYNSSDHVFDAVPEGTVMYHLDENGNRDSLVDPYTGMAYVENPEGGVMVWPVRFPEGKEEPAEKIRTFRIAAPRTEEGRTYTVGTYGSDDRGEKRLLCRVNPAVDEHGLPVFYQKSEESFERGSPVFDRDGDFLWFWPDPALEQQNRNGYEIHSSEELNQTGRSLYRRQGESFLMENTWRTGDQQVNDPFAETIGPGQADVLERIMPGSYILEEKTPPAGWTKGLPQAVTVKESLENQTISVENSPTRVLIWKIDGTENWRTEVEDLSGILAEPEYRISRKGSYRFDSVAGAKLALYPARKVYEPGGEFRYEKTSEKPISWTSGTKNGKEERTAAVWESGKEPKMLEGIPAGIYLLEETDTPPGYLPASMPVEIRPSGELQYFSLKNDHTRVAFFKYINEDGTLTSLTNRNRAEFSLYPARMDEEGTVQRAEDGTPLYDPGSPVEVWQTEDCLEYTKTVDTRKYGESTVFSRFLSWLQELAGVGDRYLTGFTWDYEKLFDEYGTDFDVVSWKEERTAVRSSVHDRVWLSPEGGRIVTGGGEILYPEDMDDTDRKEFEKELKGGEDRQELSWLRERQAHRIASEETEGKERVVQMWETDSGDMIRVCSGRNLLNAGEPSHDGTYGDGRSFGRTFEYQFHYREFPVGDGTMAVSYNMADGGHYLERLPSSGEEKGSGCYVLAETGTPEGMIPSKPVLVEIRETPKLQICSVENRRRCVLADKQGTDGRPVEGALLGLYRADGQGMPVLDEEHLVTSWRSGTDGVYSRREKEEGTIPEGRAEGDLRPHRIEGIEEGEYYLAELEAPPYYRKMEPKKLMILGEETELIRGVNEIKLGRLEVEKEGEDGRLLAGAEFTLTNEETGEVRRLVTGVDGKASASDLIVGLAGEGGAVTPCTYRLEETVPPPFYQKSREPLRFSFEDGEEAELFRSLRVENRQTEFEISKTDAGSGAPVKGALLEIYRAVGTSEGLEREGEVLDTWISDGSPHKIRGKISGGESAILAEKKTPAGRMPAEPVAFTLSADGREVEQVDCGFAKISVAADEDSGGRILEVKGRQPESAKRQTTCVPENGEAEENKNLYRIQEKVLYSDGREERTSSVLVRMEKGEWEAAEAREPVYTELTLAGEDEGRFWRWRPGGDGKDPWKLSGKEENGSLPGGVFALKETTVFSDGTGIVTGTFAFRLDENGRLTELILPNRESELSIWKQTADGRGLPGALLSLNRQDGTRVDRWISGSGPHRIQGKAEPGELLILEELRPPAGYERAAPMAFQVLEDGRGELVIMRDQKLPGDGGEGTDEKEPDEKEPEQPNRENPPEERVEEENSGETVGRILACYPRDRREMRRGLPPLGETAGRLLPLLGTGAGLLLLAYFFAGRGKRK